MLIHTTCPNCRHPCTWSDTSETNYVCFCHCEKTFEVSGWGTARPAQRRRPRSRSRTAHWPWLLLAAVGILILVLSLTHRSSPSVGHEPKVSWENFQRLRAGMKDGEVYKILGNLSRIDRGIVPQVGTHLSHRFTVDEDEFPQRYFWEEGEDVIWVLFVRKRVQEFGGRLEGEQIGKEPKEPLVKGLQEKGD